jgi:hypothetical protein
VHEALYRDIDGNLGGAASRSSSIGHRQLPAIPPTHRSLLHTHPSPRHSESGKPPSASCDAHLGAAEGLLDVVVGADLRGQHRQSVLREFASFCHGSSRISAGVKPEWRLASGLWAGHGIFEGRSEARETMLNLKGGAGLRKVLAAQMHVLRDSLAGRGECSPRLCDH